MVPNNNSSSGGGGGSGSSNDNSNRQSSSSSGQQPGKHAATSKSLDKNRIFSGQGMSSASSSSSGQRMMPSATAGNTSNGTESIEERAPTAPSSSQSKLGLAHCYFIFGNYFFNH